MRYFMKSYILPLILAGLLLQGCSSNNTSTAQSGKDNKSNPSSQGKGTEQPTLTATPAIPKDDSSKPPKPAEDGKTASGFYDHLKSKGWEINDLKPVQLRMFGSEESASFKDSRNIGYLVMRYDNPEKARNNFGGIDETYKQKFGRALISQNFVVAVFGIVRGTNKPQIIQLGEEAYKILQAELDEFVKAPKSS
jgi:hypothetical protein